VTRPFDWHDADDVRRLVLDLRVAFDDVNAIVADLLRPPRERELGPVLHRDGYQEARGKLVALLAWCEPREPEGGDPAGCGGAGATH
jgi:hypothetical protein